MGDNAMTTSLTALTPIFALIALGLGLARTGLIPAEGWRAVERLVYFVFFPALLFASVAGAELGGSAAVPMAVALLGAVGLMIALVTGYRVWRGVAGPTYTSMIQGTIRPNIYIGLSVAGALFGAEGVVYGALGLAIVVPIVNAVSVLALVRHGSTSARTGLGTTVRAIASNPLILATIAGVLANTAGLDLTGIPSDTLNILGRPVLPLGLIAVGANLRFDVMRRGIALIGVTAGAKLLVLPAMAYAIGWAIGLEGAVLAVATLWHAMPVAPSSYVLARQLGGEAELMAGIITVTTLAALITLPIVLAVLALRA